MELVHPEQGIGNAGSAMCGDGTCSSSCSGKDPNDEFNSNYDLVQDQDDLAFFSSAQASFWGPYTQYSQVR